jgi:hypothetical protein
MNAFNRIVTTLVLLALIPIVTVGFIAPREAVQLLLDVFGGLEAQLDSSPSALQILVRIVAALLIDAVLVALLYFQVRRPAKPGVRMQQIVGGEAQIAVESVIGRLTYNIDRLPGVLEVVPTVIPRGKAVEVLLDIEMTADANITANIEEVSAVTRRVIEEDMGLKLKGKPKLKLRTMTYPELVPGTDAPGPAIASIDYAVGEEVLQPAGDEEPAPSDLSQEPGADEADEPSSANDPD